MKKRGKKKVSSRWSIGIILVVAVLAFFVFVGLIFRDERYFGLVFPFER